MPSSKRKNSGKDSRKAASASARKRQAAKKRKIAAIRKKLKVGRIKNAPKHEFVRSRVTGNIKRAHSIESGKSRMAIYEDSDGVKVHIRRLEAGTEQDLGLTMAAVIDRFSKNQKKAEQAEVVRVFTSLDDLSRLDDVDKALKSLKDDPRIQAVEFDKDTEILKFKKHNGIRENAPNTSDIAHLTNYLQRESGDRSNKAYQQVVGLLNQAIRIDQEAAGDAEAKQSKADRLKALSKQIDTLMKQAESTNRSDRKAEQRNMALKNMKVMLDDHIQNVTKESGEYGPVPDLSQFDSSSEPDPDAIEPIYDIIPDLKPEADYGPGPAVRPEYDKAPALESEYGPAPPENPDAVAIPADKSVYGRFPPPENILDSDGNIDDGVNRDTVDMEIDDGIDVDINDAVDSDVSRALDSNEIANDSTDSQSDQTPLKALPSREEQVEQIVDGIEQMALTNPMLEDVLKQLYIGRLPPEAKQGNPFDSR